MFLPIESRHPAALNYIVVTSELPVEHMEPTGGTSAEYRRGTGEIAEAIRKASGDICFWLFMIWAINTALQASGII